MRFNFKKIAAIGTSILLTGMSMGVATAASYPAPFVVGGNANVGIVYGTGAGVSPLDGDYATDISDDLATYVSAGGSVTTSGEVVSLDTSATRIWLNTSLNTAKSTLTKSDLATVLADTEFSGNVDATLTQTIKLQAGLKTGTNGEASGRVVFAKQPSSSDDPVVGISLGTSASNILYNASVSFKPINFTHSDSEGETITLFGKEFVVSTQTDTTDLVLFSSAEQVILTKTSTGGASTATVDVSGSSYEVELLNGDSTSATITVNGASGTVTEGGSKKIGGIEIAVKDVVSSDAGGITATLLVGSEKITFTNGATVTKGADEDPIDGTKAYLTGGTGAMTSLNIAVYRPDSSNDAILEGGDFVDPVFESFKVSFAGLNSPLTDAERDMISIQNSGDDTMSITLTEVNGNLGTAEFAHNQSGQWRLLDDANHTIHVHEMANISQDEFVILGNEEYGRLLEVTYVYNSSDGDHTKHKVEFTNVFDSTDDFDTVFASDTTGTVYVDGKAYTVTLHPTGEGSDTSRIQIKYPTSDAGTDTFVVFPTFQTEGGANVALYEPLTWVMGSLDLTATGDETLKLPDGDGYASFALTYIEAGTWSVGGVALNTSGTGAGHGNHTTLTVGELTYNLTGTSTANVTQLFLMNPEGGAHIDNPAVVIFEEKDDQSEYEVLIVDLEDDPAGSSTNGAGVADVLSTAKGSDKYWAEASLASDSDITKMVDWYGTLATLDAGDSDQKTVTVAYPDTQVYAQIYIGEGAASVTGEGGNIGDVIYRDSEVSSASTKNLIIVGGSCINSAAATLVGGAYCGAEWTTATGVGSGQFLIKSYDGGSLTSGIALLVAGYEVADTLNAATYLTNEKPSTDEGDKWVGTSAQSATLQVN